MMFLVKNLKVLIHIQHKTLQKKNLKKNVFFIQKQTNHNHNSNNYQQINKKSQQFQQQLIQK